ncbi:MAG: response regulator receiver protein [Hyphomicrobiales bacterium]|nr:response regulator receiver protein [Hyphomicrobiales bacterium]
MTDSLATSPAPDTHEARKAPLSAHVFVGDQDSEGVIRQSLTALGLENTSFTTGTVDTAVTAFKKDRSPDLLIVDVSGIVDPVASMRKLADVCEPDVRVLVVGDENDIILYRDLKNIGINEYFLKPIVRDIFSRTCNNILFPNAAQPRLRTGKLIFMLGVRGGVGTTTIATNTAWNLAEIRHRHTMLLDLDVQCGDTALQLDTSSSNALREAFEHPERVDKLYIERGARHLSERLDLLATQGSPADPLVPRESGALPLLEKLITRYRFIIVDLPAYVASNMPRLLHMPSVCILVSNSSLSAARDVARWRQYLGANTPERSTIHVANHVTPHAGLSEEDFAKGCGHPPEIVIPYDSKLSVASSYGISGMQQCTTFNKGLSKLLNNLTGDAVRSSRPLLSKIFG